MAKDISLNSDVWRDLVFENKNKAYGAYRLRGTSSKRHVVAFIIIACVVVGVCSTVQIVRTIREQRAKELEGLNTSVKMSNIEEEKEEEDVPPPPPEETPPPPVRATIQFTPPVVASDSEVTEENQMKDQAELQQTKTAIGVFNQEGTNDLNALTRDEAMLQAGVSGETGVKQKEKVYDFVQKMPSFPGGQSALYSYLGENIKYPPSASENGIEGKATITFVVERDGSITDVKIARGFDPACDSEAARVVRAMPKWVPGEQNGKTVRVQYTLPVFFQLQK